MQNFGHALDVIAKLLQGEKDLETYLLENPPSEVNVQTAKEKLVAAERNLRYVFNRCPKEKVVYIVRYWLWHDTLVDSSYSRIWPNV